MSIKLTEIWGFYYWNAWTIFWVFEIEIFRDEVRCAEFLSIAFSLRKAISQWSKIHTNINLRIYKLCKINSQIILKWKTHFWLTIFSFLKKISIYHHGFQVLLKDLMRKLQLYCKSCVDSSNYTYEIYFIKNHLRYYVSVFYSHKSCITKLFKNCIYRWSMHIC